MIDFNQQYNRKEFLDFLSGFLPDDFEVEIKDGDFDESFERITAVVELGKVKSLGTLRSLRVYEIKHRSENDPRVSLTKEAFWIMKDKRIRRALMVFSSNYSKNYRFSLMTIDLKEDGKKVKQEFSNPRRYSFFLGPDSKTHTPNRFLVKNGGVKDFEDLLSRFAVEVVNKDFYRDISECFYKLAGAKIGNKTYKRILELPSVNKNDYKKYQEFAVRLIGRIIFIWFLKHKKSNINTPLIPHNLISSQAVDSFPNYYHEVLEKLFFEILNKPIQKRKKDILPNFDLIPFLNGGLFDPQGDDFYEDKPLYNLTIQDDWFREFFKILELYNFTIDESTPTDIEISVDPEMLGRIFENLLAEINPNTGESARKATGSYYTPRVIVEYMVSQSMKYYLLNKTNIKENKIENLLSYSDDNIELTENEKNNIIKVLDEIKIIDPACGSGAFPMGVLQKMLLVLQKVDPQSKKWLSKQLAKIDNEIARKEVEKKLKNENWDYIHKLGIIQNSIYGVDIQPIAVEISKLRFFLSLIVDEKIEDEKENRGIDPLPNLEFKFVCANTLIPAPEEKQTDGLNLKFLKDNFFVKLEKMAEDFFNISDSKEKEDKKMEIKKLIDGKVKEKITQIENLGKSNFGEKYNKVIKAKNEKAISENTRLMSLWKSYINIFTTDSHVLFFDLKYFFPSAKDGFDIVIGNPPYVQLQKFSGQDIQEQYEKSGYQTFKKTGDIYSLFYERGIEMTKKDSGLLCYITSNKWMRAGYGESLRKYFSEKNPLQLLDFGGFKVFESATVDTNILLVQNADNKNKLQAVHFKNDYKKGEEIKKYFDENKTELKNLSSDTWFIGSQAEVDLKKKIEEKGVPLKDWDVKIYRGILTGFNEAFIIDEKTKNELIKKDPKSEEIIKPILRGRDIKKYGYEFAGLWILVTEFDIDIPKLYPAVFGWLKRFENKLKKRDDQGKNWWNLRACAYYKEFEKEKIVWGNIAYENSFCYSKPNEFINAPANILTSEKVNLKFLLGCMNSKMFNYEFSNSGIDLGKAFEWKKQYVEKIHIPKISIEQQKPFINLVDQILKKKKDNPEADVGELEREIDEMVYGLYNLTKEETDVVESN